MLFRNFAYAFFSNPPLNQSSIANQQEVKTDRTHVQQAIQNPATSNPMAYSKYSMYGIDSPQALGLASANIQKLTSVNGCDQSSTASHRLRTTTSTH